MKTMHLITPSPAEQFPLELTEAAAPVPPPGLIRLRISVCGVCHTDLHVVEGDIHPKLVPITPGHQVVGFVDMIGAGVTGINLGDRLGVPWLYSACGACEFCLRGEENLCSEAQFTGFHVHGGFAEYMLADPRYSFSLTGLFDDVLVAPLLCAGIIGYRSLRKADLRPGERLGLIGFGASAHLAIQIARYWGCDVYVFTRTSEHRKHAKELGATWVGSIDEIIPKKLDRAILFAPVGHFIPLVLKHLRPGGTLAINAIAMSSIPSFDYGLIYGERTIRSVANATYQDGVELLELAKTIPIHPSVVEYPFEQVNQALIDIKHSRINGEAVLVF